MFVKPVAVTKQLLDDVLREVRVMFQDGNRNTLD
jgi:hypothetical protein